MRRSPPPSTRRIAILVVALLLASASGCFGAGDDTSDPGAKRVRQDALSAMADVSSYDASISMTVDANDGSLEADFSGFVHETSRRMSFDVSVPVPGRGTQETTAYVVNQTQYQRRGDR